MSTAAGASSAGGTARDTTDLVRKAAMAVGVVFVLVGLLGFVPGITTDIYPMDLYGEESDAMLLGIFQVSVLHNLVHLLYGVAGIAMSRRTETARTYLLVGGAIYLVLWVYGLIVGPDASANFVPLNTADDWLHFVLGVGMIALGMLGRRDTASSTGGLR